MHFPRAWPLWNGLLALLLAGKAAQAINVDINSERVWLQASPCCKSTVLTAAIAQNRIDQGRRKHRNMGHDDLLPWQRVRTDPRSLP